MNWKAWGVGALNAVISGLTSGGVGIAIGVGWRKALWLVGASAVVSFGKWIAQHPLPGTPSTP
jgi:hypothetical protein